MRCFFCLLVLLAVVCPRLATATAQTPDWFIYHGDTLRLYSNPLEQWLAQLPSRPAELQGDGSTACWRGYEATWQLEDGRLYLLAVQPCGGKPIAAAVLQQWFPFDNPRRIAATWVTGQLDVVKGKLLRYVHMGYESIYGYDWLLRFANGKLVGQQTFDNRGCQANGPPGGGAGFHNQLLQAIDWHRVQAQTSTTLKRVFIEFRPDSTGHSCRVILRKSCGLPYDSLAMAAARQVANQNWGTCYRFGRWLPSSWTVPLSFAEADRLRNKHRSPAGTR